MQINELVNKVGFWSRNKGWWEKWNIGEKLLLITSEISEAFEEHRNHHEPTEIYYVDGSPKPEGIPIEIADAVIRIADFCAYYGIDLEKALELKLAYNETRPYRHGGKQA